MTPAYLGISTQRARAVTALPASGSFPGGRVLRSALPNGVPVLLIDCPALFCREGGPYQSPSGSDWEDNDLRFAMLCKSAAAVAAAPAGSWRPDVVHCNDWQTGLAPSYLRYGGGSPARSVFTIHNLAFQGVYGADSLARLGLPQESFTPDGVEYYGNVSFLKSGLAFADAITTVSPTYAHEIQTPEGGMGMDGILRHRKSVLTGILNGIDTDAWNPATDAFLTHRYDSNRLRDKALCKAALQLRLGVGPSTAPMLATVGRLTFQKGVDWLLECVPMIADAGAQLVVLGQGEEQFHREWLRLQQRHPQHLSVTLGFDEALAHQIEAGADMFLMPSRFEPCGMNQMYSQRYGTVPVVRATGGLVDTVVDHPLPNATGRWCSPAGRARARRRHPARARHVRVARRVGPPATQRHGTRLRLADEREELLRRLPSADVA